jgi:lipoprotein-anchoring transpeptidase ErfK/SrfK
MSRWSNAVKGVVGVLLSLSMLVGPASARSPNLFEQLFNPDGGPRFTQDQPRRATPVRTSKKVRLDPQFQRQVVSYRTSEAAGTVVVNTGQKFLYLVLGNGKAMRYGIGTARDGFEWSGTHRVSAKKEWPSWTPPAAMRKRQPGLPVHMKGGPDNPLGARALYIGSTLYRIHGTNEPWTIGGDVSSGCIRMVNDDVIDLYDRVKIGAKVVVL